MSSGKKKKIKLQKKKSDSASSNASEKQRRDSKHYHIKEDLFAAYYTGSSVQEIHEMFNVPLSTLYHIKRTDEWDSRRARVDEMAKHKMDTDLAIKKSEMSKMVSVLISQAGKHLMELGQKGTAAFKVSDLVNLIKTHQLLAGEATERFSIYDKDMIKDMVHEMSPAERGVILSLFDKLDQKMKADQSTKESHLKLVN